MIAILTDRSPAGEKRPDRTIVVSASAESRSPLGDDAHSPIGLMFRICELRDHSLRVFLLEQTEPHRHRRQHTGFINGLPVVIECKRVAVFLCEPGRFLYLRL